MSIYRNQRTESRTSIAGEIKYSRESDGFCYDARIFDCGRHGMGLISDFPYLRDTELFLKSKDDKENVIQRAEVAWSRPAYKSTKLHPQYRVGLKLPH